MIMNKNVKHIKFRNTQNPKSTFDLVNIEEVFTRKNLDHSPLKLHLVEFFIILLIEDGTGFHTIDFTNYSFKKGTLIKNWSKTL